MREKAIKRTSVFAALLFACILIATALVIFPNTATSASADAAADTAARNANLVVRYDMGNIEGGAIKASKWENGKFVAYSDLDATISGTVTAENGKEGSGAARFSSADATAKTTGTLQLPSGATGVTVTAWIKNLVGDWGALVEFFGGSQGGRIGRGTVGYNDGTYNNGEWNYRTYPGAGASFPNGGSWNTFVTNNDGSGTDACAADTWYFVAFTLTQNSLIHYRNAISKIVYPNSGDEKAERIVSKIWEGVSSGNSKIALRPQFYDSTALGTSEEIDDLRIYNGAMSQSEVNAVYAEYQAIASLGQKKIKTDDENFGNIEVGVQQNAAEIVVTDKTAAFPKLLIGGASAADVTENEGTFSYTGGGISYSYTVSGDEASVALSDTATGATIWFTVTRTTLPAYYTDLKVSIDGGAATTLDGFLLNKQDYTLALTPDNYSVEFSGTVGAGTSDVDTVNANINYNGANTITVTGDDSSTFTYTVTISRDRSDVLPIVCGQTIDRTTQVIYVEGEMAELGDGDVELTYPNGAEMSNFAFSGGVATFTLTDKAVSTNTTNYSVTVKSKKAGQIGYWDLNETSGTSYAGKSWNESTGAFAANSNLTMYTHVGGHQVAPTSGRTKTAPTSVDGKLGKGIQLANWGYTEANMPTVANATGFTFSTWMKTSGIAWEAIFAVYDKNYTEGVIFEKGHMQWPKFENGNTSSAYGGDFDPNQATWKSGLSSADARKDYFNSTSFVLYTVTVSYVNNVGVVKFYKNGELAATYNNVADGNTVAQRTIGALNNGGYIGLHRHIYDGGQQSSFDDVRMFAYAMTDAEVTALYTSTNNVATVNGKSVDIQNNMVDYPVIKFNVDDMVDVTGGVGNGTMANGVRYTYTLPAGNSVSKATDKTTVTVYKDTPAYIDKTVEVTFNRTFAAPVAQTLGYKIGTGENVELDVQATQSATVPGNVDLTQANAITKGDCSAVVEFGATASAYNIAFAYNASTKTATYTVTYSDYTDIKTVYTVTFVNQKYTVTYNLNGATGTAPEQLTDVVYGTKLTEPTEPTWTGHVFKGWYSDQTCTTEWDFDTDTVTADTILYAKWAVGYAITYYDGTTPLSFTGKNGYESGVGLTLPGVAEVSKTGYTFIGWYESSDLSGTAVTTITATDTGDKTFYAKFEANTYTITWNANGGTLAGDEPATIEYDSDLTLPTPPTKAGYTFVGWFTDLDDPTTQVTAGKWTIAENVTLYAKFTETMYTVSFDLQDGSVNATVQVAENDTLTEPADPTRGSYRFEGWYADAACTTPWDFDTPITEDVTIYAKWAPVFTVTFDLNGGTGTIEAVTVDAGEKISAPATNPTRSGYTFGGWYKEVACTTAWDFENDTVTAPTILYAKWTAVATDPVQYTVTFDSNGGSSVATATVANGGKVSKPANPAKDGYVFKGWYKDAACTQEWSFENDTVTTSVTLYAKWEAAPVVSPVAEKKGCGSSVMAETSAIVALLMLALAGVIVLKKKAESK